MKLLFDDISFTIFTEPEQRFIPKMDIIDFEMELFRESTKSHAL